MEIITEFNMNKNVYYYMLTYYNKSNIYKNINWTNTEFNMNKNVDYYMLTYYNNFSIYKNINGNNYWI